MLGLGFEIKPDRFAAGVNVVQQLDDTSIGTSPYNAVDFGDKGLKLFAVTLRKATGNNELLSLLLALRVFKNYFGRFGLCRIDERTRVDDDGIRVGGIRNELVARGAELRYHDFGVDEILGAAETNKRDAGHSYFLPVIDELQRQFEVHGF